jgi:hypothetical protein
LVRSRPQALLDQADEAMYHSKKIGRDGVPSSASTQHSFATTALPKNVRLIDGAMNGSADQ